VRTVLIGLLTVIWTTLLAKDPPLTILTNKTGEWLLVAAGCCIAGLVIDLLQYLFGYLMSSALVQRLENKQGRQSYDRDDLQWKLKQWFFWLKQILAVAAAIIFICVIVAYLFKNF